MGDAEVMELRKEIKEIKDGQKKFDEKQDQQIIALNEMKVLLAGQYVTKTEFEKHKETDEEVHNTLHGRITNTTIGLAGAAVLFLLGVIVQVALLYVKLKG